MYFFPCCISLSLPQSTSKVILSLSSKTQIILPSKTPSPILPSKTPPSVIKHGAKTQRSQKEKNRGKGKGKATATAAANVSKPITNFFRLGQTTATNVNASPSSTAVVSKTTTQSATATSARNPNGKESATPHIWEAWKGPPPNVGNNGTGTDVSTVQPAQGAPPGPSNKCESPLGLVQKTVPKTKGRKNKPRNRPASAQNVPKPAAAADFFKSSGRKQQTMSKFRDDVSPTQVAHLVNRTFDALNWPSPSRGAKDEDCTLQDSANLVNWMVNVQAHKAYDAPPGSTSKGEDERA